MTDVSEINKLLKEDKLVIGTDETMKGLRKGSFEKVLLASNCPSDIRADVKHYADIDGIEVVDLEVDNSELKDVCKRPHNISVIGVLKQ